MVLAIQIVFTLLFSTMHCMCGCLISRWQFREFTFLELLSSISYLAIVCRDIIESSQYGEMQQNPCLDICGGVMSFIYKKCTYIYTSKMVRSCELGVCVWRFLLPIARHALLLCCMSITSVFHFQVFPHKIH